MKTLSRNFLAEMLANPINRNLILILVSALLVAISIVTAGFFVYDQW